MFELPVKNTIDRGRNLAAGYERGVNLMFGGLAQLLEMDELYVTSRERVADRTLSDAAKMMNIYLILKYYLDTIPGDIVEFGCYRGGMAMFIASVCKTLYPDRQIIALDSFEGMPASDDLVDWHAQGEFGDLDYNEVRARANELGLDNLKFVKGFFENTAAAALHSRSVSLVHIDCDIKSSVSFAYQTVLPHMTKGSYVIFDDATAPTCLGATEAVEEIIQQGKFSEQIWPHYVFRVGL